MVKALKYSKKTNVDCPVIFTTAYDEYAIKAFKVNSVDYLLKPIEESHLEAALHKYEELFLTDKQPTDISELVRLMNEKKKVRKRFLIKAGNKLSFIPVNEVALFLSEASTTFLVTRSNERFILDQTLDELTEEVSSEDFFRINRKFLVGIESIEKVEPYFNNRLLVHTSPDAGEEVVVSRQRTRDFKQWMDS